MPVDEVRTLVIDVDGTLAGPPKDGDYAACEVIEPVAEQVRAYAALGWKIVLYTARNMRTHHNNLAAITAHTVPTLVSWLNDREIPYDEIMIGKPWPGSHGFYVDDRTLRPDEFLALKPGMSPTFRSHTAGQ